MLSLVKAVYYIVTLHPTLLMTYYGCVSHLEGLYFTVHQLLFRLYKYYSGFVQYFFYLLLLEMAE